MPLCNYITEVELEKREILMYKNLDLDNLITPVDADRLEQILLESNYNKSKTQFLVDGFRNGFTLGYQGEV